MHAQLRGALLAVAAAASVSSANAAVIFSGISGSLSASATFNVVGSQLQLILQNTASSDVLVPTDVLTSVFFKVAGNPALVSVSAISGGPTYLGTTNVSGAGTAVGGEWAYADGLTQYGANAGVSSSGLGIFGPSDRFPGSNLSGPASPDGLQYGLASAGDNQATGNAAVLGNELTKSSVTFLFNGFGTRTLADISAVTFQYGTDLSEPHFGGTTPRVTPTDIPEPLPLTLFGIGALALTLVRRRSRR